MFHIVLDWLAVHSLAMEAANSLYLPLPDSQLSQTTRLRLLTCVSRTLHVRLPICVSRPGPTERYHVPSVFRLCWAFVSGLASRGTLTLFCAYTGLTYFSVRLQIRAAHLRIGMSLSIRYVEKPLWSIFALTSLHSPKYLYDP